MYTRTSIIAALKDHLAKLPFPVVFDHFGRADPVLGTSQPGFDALTDLVKSGDAYVKISGAYRVSQKASCGAPIGRTRTPITGAASR